MRRAVASVAHPPQRTGYTPLVRRTNHNSAVHVAHPLHEGLSRALLRGWRDSRATLCPLDSQVFRDAAREDCRSLGTIKIERAVKALATVDPQAARGILEAMAAELLAFAEVIAPQASACVHTAWSAEQREDAEADVAVVGTIGSAELRVVDAALAEQSQKVAAGLRTQAALLKRRGEITRPMSHGWRA